MERIRKALERAHQDRLASGADAKGSPSENMGNNKGGAAAQAQDLSAGIVYTQTKRVEVAPQFLLDKRIISALPEHEFKDSYRMLRTRVLQSMRNNEWTSVAVTGPASGCGKTLTAINLAVSLAMEVSSTVLLVDLDLRAPAVHKYFGYEPDFGIASFINGDVPLNKLLFSPGIERLVILPGLDVVANSSEMLRSPRMVALVNELTTRYPDRLVVFDLPPVLAADDALAFSPYTDCILMVAESGATKKDDLQKAYEVLKGTPIVGTVLNKSESPSVGYGYGGVRKKRFFRG